MISVSVSLQPTSRTGAFRRSACSGIDSSNVRSCFDMTYTFAHSPVTALAGNLVVGLIVA